MLSIQSIPLQPKWDCPKIQLQLPKGANIIGVTSQDRFCRIHVECDTDNPVEQRTIVSVASGVNFPFDRDQLIFIGTATIQTVQMGNQYWHFYELIGDEIRSENDKSEKNPN